MSMSSNNNVNEANEPKIIFSRQLRRFGVKTKTFMQTKGKQNVIILGALLVLVAIFTAINPNFLDKYNILSISQNFAPYAIMAIGVTFVIATGGIDLSIGTVCIASAVFAGKLFMDGMPLPFVIPIILAIGTLFGTINGFLVAKLKMPAFIATLGTMLLARGLSALVVNIPNIFFPTGTWYNLIFSNMNNFPIGFFWALGLMLVAMYFMYKNKIGRYILSIGSNEEATRLSGINTVKYKWIAYIIAGLFAGIAAIFWSASFPTVSSASGNGMELDAIAGVYIGGTSAAGGIASVAGSFIGSILLIVIRQGLNFALAVMGLNLNAQYITYVLTGIIVVAAVLMDVVKQKKAEKVVLLKESQKIKKEYNEHRESMLSELDILLSTKGKEDEINALKAEIEAYKTEMFAKIESAKLEEKNTKKESE